MRTVRPPAVAGMFYPADPDELASTVDDLLQEADAVLTHSGAAIAEAGAAPKAVIVPHAGYVYSGATAALAYALLRRHRDDIHRVVLLGPTHRVPCWGLAHPQADAFATPLGIVPVERPHREVPHVVYSARVHEQEHSLEVQVPFLQRALGPVTLAPYAVGQATPREVADALDALWDGPETVVIVSSDLSHYLGDEQARSVDRETVGAILQHRGPLGHEQACGATPINGLMLAGERHGLTPTLLGMCNSADTAGDSQRVVGYASLAYDVMRSAA
ncbi:MAG: AmmeMemoRadiSam system protein B [Dermatophilaceae bacterium]